MPLILSWLFLISLAGAAPLKLLVIGDSQSEEYAFEVPFTAPNSDPLQANTENWIEILAAHRPAEVNFGSYADTILSYPDLRNGGFEFNWGVPGAETETWANIVTSSIFDNQEFLTSKAKLIEQLPQMDAIVIILGGNDANGDYRALYNNTPPTNWQNNIIANHTTIIDFIRTWSEKPIILANIPDVGATQLVINKFPDQEKRALATTHIIQANTAITQFAQSKGASLINFFSITEQLTQDGPIRIDNIEFFPFSNPENTPRHLLCKDGFHPATATQSLLANLILEALGLTPLTNDEILSNILAIPPTQDDAYLTWITNITPITSFLADPDGDGLPNLGEYALAKNPTQADAPLFTYRPDPTRASFTTTRPMTSDNLIDWFSADGINQSTDGSITINSTRPFLRLEFEPTK